MRFARVCSNVSMPAKLLNQGHQYNKICKVFSKVYHRHSELIVKHNIGLKTLLRQGISELIFYSGLVYKFKRLVGKPTFSDQFQNIIQRFKKVAYNMGIIRRQSACLFVNTIMVFSFSSLYNARSWVRPQTQ